MVSFNCQLEQASQGLSTLGCLYAGLWQILLVKLIDVASSSPSWVSPFPQQGGAEEEWKILAAYRQATEHMCTGFSLL